MDFFSWLWKQITRWWPRKEELKPLPAPEPTPEPEPEPAPAPPDSANLVDDINLTNRHIKWKGDRNPRNWPVVSDLAVEFHGNRVRFEKYDTRMWPDVGGVNACWVVAKEQPNRVILMQTVDGIRTGTNEKHFTCDPSRDNVLRFFDSEIPQSGNVYYFAVAGLCRRSDFRNVKQRTRFVRVVWP